MAVITVSQLNNYVKRYFDANSALASLWIKGEISNFKLHSSGHIYMTLKDSGATLKCVMFSSNVQRLKFRPDNGMKVVAMGRVSVYERDGVYQLYVEQLIPDGMGELYAAYEQLKEALELAGYFDASAKKSIPSYPEKIGIVTSPQGAVLKDMLNILNRRYPLAEIYVYPALVQGVGAASTIAEGIEYFNNDCIVDTIIIGRGGGSIEDLWAFNERAVADAIFASVVPVISAVGHETDFTIADFVADLRAPTPSAAAELAVPDINELTAYLEQSKSRMFNALNSLIKVKKARLDYLLQRDLHKTVSRYIEDCKLCLDSTIDNMNDTMQERITNLGNRFSSLCIKLDALSPLKVLSRGYAVVAKDENNIKSISDLSVGDSVNVRISDGQLLCDVREIKK